MAQWNSKILEKFFAPGITGFTEAEIPDLKEKHKEAEHWLPNHMLNSVFGGRYSDEVLPFALNMMFRAQVAFKSYHTARDATLEYLKDNKPDNPKIRIYFKAISEWETCLLNLQIFMDLGNNFDVKLRAFDKNDGSPFCRAYTLANIIKHWGGSIKDNKHSDKTIPVWLTNKGFSAHNTVLNFSELAELIDVVAEQANGLQNPVTPAKEAEALKSAQA